MYVSIRFPFTVTLLARFDSVGFDSTEIKVMNKMYKKTITNRDSYQNMMGRSWLICYNQQNSFETLIACRIPGELWDRL